MDGEDEPKAFRSMESDRDVHLSNSITRFLVDQIQNDEKWAEAYERLI